MQHPKERYSGRRVELGTSDGYRMALRSLPGSPKQPADALGPLVGIEEVIPAICAASAPTRLAALRAQYKAGRSVDCGGFQLSREGISVRGRALSSSALADIQADLHLMVLKAAGQAWPWAMFELKNVLNADILPELIAAVQGTGYSIYQAAGATADLEAARKVLRRRERLVSWLLWPLLLVIINVVIQLGRSAP